MVASRVTVVGGSGMLGAMLVDVLSREPDIELAATVRSEAHRAWGRDLYPQVSWRLFDAATSVADLDRFAADVLAHTDWLINAIGITKPLIHDDNPAEVARAVRVNALFPLWLAQTATPVLQIATDCVFSGARGGYVESDPHDAIDAYGKTKSLGEAQGPHIRHLRCSIIGPEPHEPKFLLEWLLRQGRGATVPGYTNHDWNGVTTLHFARICLGVVRSQAALPHVSHVIPSGSLTKCELLQAAARRFGRDDLRIEPRQAGSVVDRTLATDVVDRNRGLWAAAGYESPPTLEQMLDELAGCAPRFAARRTSCLQAT
jgi:dTDP-4-dehydrorhamnose reductase